MKKKITAVALVIAILAIGLIGGTLAYFTDTTDVATNTFTAGKVGISLWENGKEVSANFKGETYTALKPGQTVNKAVQVKVDTDSLNAYVAARVVVTGANLMELLGVDGQYVDLTGLVAGGCAEETVAYATGYAETLAWETSNYVLTQTFDTQKNEYVFTYYFKNAQAKDATLTLFNTLTVPDGWDNADMAKFNGMEMKITAYAVQADDLADGLDSCYKAINATFFN